MMMAIQLVYPCDPTRGRSGEEERIPPKLKTPKDRLSILDYEILNFPNSDSKRSSNKEVHTNLT